MTQQLASGMRVVIRDEELLVRRVDPSVDGGHVLCCDGISELVRGQEALFLTALEGPIDDGLGSLPLIRHIILKDDNNLRVTGEVSVSK